MGLEPELLLKLTQLLHETDIDILNRNEMNNRYEFFALKPEFSTAKTPFTPHQ